MMFKKLAVPIILFILIAGSCLLYIMAVRDMIYELYHGRGPVWLNDLVLKLYPRFDVEKHRFNFDFFIGKADQVVIRSTLVSILAILFYAALNFSNSLQNQLINYWNSEIPVKRVQILRIVTGLLFIYFSWEIVWDMEKLLAIRAFYNPIPIYKILHIPFPSYEGIIIIYSLLMLSSLCLLLNFFSVLSSTLSITFFILIQGYYFSFEKIDHGYATFIYSAMVFPFLLLEYNKARSSGRVFQKGWPLQLIMLLISLVYLLSGMEKLSISGINWINADTFKAYLLLHEAPLGISISKIEWLCILLPACALLFQLCFFLNLVFVKYRWLFLLTGVLFHCGTVALFDISSFINPWILVYAMFIDWEKLVYFVGERLKFRFLIK